jgi:hypothetical protein
MRLIARAMHEQLDMRRDEMGTETAMIWKMMLSEIMVWKMMLSAMARLRVIHPPRTATLGQQ